LKKRLMESDSEQVKLNRKLLFIGMMLFITLGFIYSVIKVMDNIQETGVTLYYSDKSYSLLVSEEHFISSIISKDEKIHHTMSLLIQGPRNPNLKPLIAHKTQIKAIWLINSELHIHLSRDFLNNQIKGILDERLIAQSIVSTMFESFSDVDKIKIHVGYGFQKTIFGGDRFDSFYHRESYRIDPLYEN
ncbi:MAG: GerMN domain-containing protein, partial [Spirochaetota bacterium]|nr:GerMN domain-containing protein [Spirochaetota bacterium]